MTIPLPPYNFPIDPIPQVTPLTYRDGWTLLKKLDYIAKYIDRTLIPFIEKSDADLAEAFTTSVNALIEAVNAAIEMVINDSVEVQDAVVEQLIENTSSLTYAALTAFLTSPASASAIDTATANNVNNVASASSVALLAKYPVYRVYNGASYPTRIPNTVNIFVGTADPGLAMSGNDVWVNDATTLDTVVSEVLMNGSPLNMAIKSVTETGFIRTASDMEVNSANAVPLSYLPVGSNSVNGTVVRLMNGNTGSYVSTMFRVPIGWNSARFYVWYTHSTVGGSGGVRFQVNTKEITVGSTIDATEQTIGASTDTINTAMLVRRVSFSTPHVFTVPTPVLLRVGLYRNTGHTGDTFTNDISLLAVEMVKDS